MIEAPTFMWFAFNVLVFMASLQAAWIAFREAQMSGQSLKHAKACFIVSVAVVLSSSTTVATTWNAAFWNGATLMSWWWWVSEAITCLGFNTDAILAVVCSGVLTPALDQEHHFKVSLSDGFTHIAIVDSAFL